MTYPEYFKSWRKANSDENKKGEAQSAQGDILHLGSRTTNDDFVEFQLAEQIKINAVNRLSIALQLIQDDIVDDGIHVMVLLR